MTRTLCLCLLVGLAASHAHAQSFNNGAFSGGLTGWTVVNTVNGTGAPGTTSAIDIDGPGPHISSIAATFGVGQAVFQSGTPCGIEMTQPISLNAGRTYTVDFDWAVLKPANPAAAEGGHFALLVNGAVIAQGASGSVSPSLPRYGHITGTFTAAATGPANVGVRITRPFVPPVGLSQYVDNFALTVAPPTATALGSLPLGTITASGTLAPGEVRWYTFTVPAVSAPAYLDIDTEGSALSPANDTELGLYTSTGALVGTDDNDGSNLLSQLTFGNTTPRPAVGNSLLYDGRDGILPAGTYYLAVSGFNSVFNLTTWNAGSTSTHSGPYQIRLARGTSVPTGGCCAPSGSCSITTQVACTTSGGTYRGDGTDCSNPCSGPGACCFIDGSCTVTSQVSCEASGGIFRGTGTTCATPCPQGACCVPTGGCSVLPQAACVAAGGTFGGDGSACAAANCPTVLFNTGRPCTVTINGTINYTGFSSGRIISQNFPQRWTPQAFALSQPSRIRTITLSGFIPVGSEFTTINYIVWRRTGTGRPLDGDQLATGSMPLPAPLQDSRIPSLALRIFTLPVDLTLSAGDYYLTVYASGEINPGGDANFAWSANPQLDPTHPGAPNTPIVISDAQGVFMWRSGTMPTPGFERFTNPNLLTDPNPTYGPNPQNPDYLYNASFTLLGDVLAVPCYANCDGSSGSPLLTANDFTCFINAYAAQSSTANCDGSTGNPLLTANDFTCFINAYAAGCS